MFSKAVKIILDWALSALILPFIAFVYDQYRIRKENKELKKVIEEFKNAKTKKDIDSSFDNLS